MFRAEGSRCELVITSAVEGLLEGRNEKGKVRRGGTTAASQCQIGTGIEFGVEQASVQPCPDSSHGPTATTSRDMTLSRMGALSIGH